MKFCVVAILVLIFVTLASASPINPDEEDNQIVLDCAKEHNISLSVLANELEATLKLAYDNINGHCFVKCVVEKLGLFDKDNGFKVESITNKFHAKDGEERLNSALKCAKQGTFSNTCEYAYRGVECFFNELAEEYLKTNPQFKYKIQCGKELKIPSSELVHYHYHSKLVGTEYAKRPIYHCFTKCFYEKIGVLEKNNSFNVKYFYDNLAGGSEKDPSGDNLAKIEKCTKESHQEAETNDCEPAFRVVDCILNAIEEIEEKKYL